MKVWVLFAYFPHEGGKEFVDTVFASKEKALEVKQTREEENGGLKYRIESFDVK